MKVAILSESPADEAAVRILVDAIRGRAIQPALIPCAIRTRGVEAAFAILPTVIRSLCYRTYSDALVVVVDSNHFPVDPTGPKADRCRLERLRRVIAETRGQLRPVAGRAPLKFAIGLAVPAVEAWYLCGKRPEVSEAAWTRGLEAGKDPYSKNRLKRYVYGTDRPSLELEKRRATEEAQRLATCLDLLEEKFPIGFGSLAQDVRGR